MSLSKEGRVFVYSAKRGEVFLLGLTREEKKFGYLFISKFR